jgi:hypothetical protein
MLEWRGVHDFPGWSVSDQGHIQNDHTGRILRVRQNRQGLVMVGLMRGGTQHTRSVAKIVANEFVRAESDSFDTVIYLNGDRGDCRATNLLWRSRPFAIRYHHMFEDLPYQEGVYIPERGERYYSLREACTTYGLIESMAHRAMLTGEPIFPYGWVLEPIAE